MSREPKRRDPWQRPHGRRTFLRASCAAAGALGLAAWQKRAIAVNEGLAPARFVFIYTPCGREPSWRTDTPGAGFTFCDTLKMFEPHREHFMIVDGLTLVNFGYANFNSHFGGLTTLLGGQMPTRRGEFNGEGLPASAQRTFDHLLGERLGAATPVPSIVVGGLDTNNDEGSQQVSWSAPGQPELPLHDPEQTFKTLFAGASQTPMPGAQDAQAAALRNDWEKQILGLTQRQTAVFKSSLGSEEARHLEAYESNLADAFRRVTSPGAIAPALPAACGSIDFAKLQQGLTSADYARTHDLQSSTLAAAIACGRTRVATYTMGSHLGSMTVAGTAKQHHQHDDGAFDHYRAFDQYYGERIKFFLDQLASYPEGDGTVLDHTVIVWTSEIGWTPSEHDHERHPVFLMGGLPGKPLKMGQYVKIPYAMGSGRDEGLANPSNRRLHELLLTLATQMGVTDLTSFADPAFVQGPLAEILI